MKLELNKIKCEEELIGSIGGQSSGLAQEGGSIASKGLSYEQLSLFYKNFLEHNHDKHVAYSRSVKCLYRMMDVSYNYLYVLIIAGNGIRAVFVYWDPHSKHHSLHSIESTLLTISSIVVLF